jgi:hypothetical protein
MEGDKKGKEGEKGGGREGGGGSDTSPKVSESGTQVTLGHCYVIGACSEL